MLIDLLIQYLIMVVVVCGTRTLSSFEFKFSRVLSFSQQMIWLSCVLRNRGLMICWKGCDVDASLAFATVRRTSTDWDVRSFGRWRTHIVAVGRLISFIEVDIIGGSVISACMRLVGYSSKGEILNFGNFKAFRILVVVRINYDCIRCIRFLVALWRLVLVPVYFGCFQ